MSPQRVSIETKPNIYFSVARTTSTQTTMRVPAILLAILAGFDMVWKTAAAPVQSHDLSEANIEARKPQTKLMWLSRAPAQKTSTCQNVLSPLSEITNKCAQQSDDTVQLCSFLCLGTITKTMVHGSERKEITDSRSCWVETVLFC